MTYLFIAFKVQFLPDSYAIILRARNKAIHSLPEMLSPYHPSCHAEICCLPSSNQSGWTQHYDEQTTSPL